VIALPSVTLVTIDFKNTIQPAYGFSQESRTQMLIACSHSEIFMAEKLGDGMNVGTAHPQPASRRMPKIVSENDMMAPAD
jgi:hypothetical protein